MYKNPVNHWINYQPKHPNKNPKSSRRFQGKLMAPSITCRVFDEVLCNKKREESDVAKLLSSVIDLLDVPFF